MFNQDDWEEWEDEPVFEEFCLWCGKKLISGTSNFCSSDCEDQYDIERVAWDWK